MESFLNSLLEQNTLQAFVEIILGVACSFAVDWIPGFTELSARAKRLYWLIVPIVFALGAMFGISLLDQAAITGEDVFTAVSVGVLVFYGAQAAHTREL